MKIKANGTGGGDCIRREQPRRDRMDGRRMKGQAGEDAAEQYLRSRGYRIIERNWRCRAGELDLIAELKGVTVFVEVRTRSGGSLLGTPEESVDVRKQHRVRRTASMFLHASGGAERPVSFDVIAVRLEDGMRVASLHHIRDAF
ncbi:YraN family protein [Paenibacillus glufosinatiresistens]|uniref:YraN family protein n=1 Tax=Paenibacillus glufosinatiresistens TaxID=3070657 RepID=UPI00286DDDC8|nr:YraN family protein [Paenibacillus sp. YX.27]